MVLFPCSRTNYLDLLLSTRPTVKRPDAAFRLRENQIPNPPPPWIHYLASGAPYPNVVVEVAVNNEDPQTLLDDANRYFSPITSTRVWIGVKVWLKGRKFWVGWAQRAVSGVGAVVHTTMQWPPNHHPCDTAVNTIYQIPMALVYGPGIPIPPNSGEFLNIDTDIIRQEIIECLM
jgi:hypothetical protein